MAGLVRFSVSLEKELSGKFDALIRKRKWQNRSEAFRKLIKQELIEEEWLKNEEVAGAIVLVYDHHRRDLLHKLTHLQHDFSKLILSTQHIHLDHHNCLEVIVVKGRPTDAQRLRDALKAIKGIKCGSLAAASTGERIP